MNQDQSYTCLTLLTGFNMGSKLHRMLAIDRRPRDLKATDVSCLSAGTNQGQSCIHLSY